MSCPYCNGRRVLHGFNEIPSWLKEEYSTQNELPVSEYPANSVRIVLWTCPTCHGDYQYRIRDCELDDDSCPFCRDKKVLPGYNSFKARHPEEMEEWDELGNYLLADSDSILSSYSKVIWWNCPKNHQYSMSPKKKLYYRMRGKEPCPYCKGRCRNHSHFF